MLRRSSVLPAWSRLAVTFVAIAVALIGASDHRARPASASDTGQEIWFAPFPYGMRGAAWQAGYGAYDFLDLFAEDAPWDEAASHVSVFKLYSQYVSDAPDAELAQVVAGLKARNIAIAVETPAFDYGACGQGVEGFAPDALAVVTTAITRIAAAGGELASIALSEPLSFGHAYDGPNACLWSTDEVAARLAVFAKAVRQLAPKVRIGTIEADWADDADILRLATAYRRASGTPLAFVHRDVHWYSPDWPRRALELEAALRHAGVPFGIIYIGNGDETTTAEWLRTAELHMATYEGAARARPPQVIFQSWHAEPRRLLPESDPNTMTALITRYVATPTWMSVSAGPAIGGKRAVQGVLQEANTVTRLAHRDVTVEVRLASGMGPRADYAIEGTVPEGATAAMVGYRLNMECSCAGPAALTLFGASFVQPGGANAISNPDFSESWDTWDAWGTHAFVPTGSGRAAQLEVEVGHGESSALNSATFAVVPGQPFSATFDATVDYRSAGSGHFIVIFLGPDGELSRASLPFRAVTTTYRARTDRYGVFRLSIPDPLADAFELLAYNEGDAEHRISAASSFIRR